jgi:membrane dipeptidase
MFNHSIHMIDMLEKIVKQNGDKISITRTPDEIMQAVHADKIAACIGVEGGTAIENDLEKLKTFYDRGVRYLGLTWNDSPAWASAAKDEISTDFAGHRGLTEFGVRVVQTMNELGMIVDISHSGEKTFWDVINTSKKPIIASHSCTYGICPSYRNLKDEQIKAISKNGGVIFINFYPGYLKKGFERQYKELRDSAATHLDSIKSVYADQYMTYRRYRNKFLDKHSLPFRPNIEIIVDHMDYIINLIGDEYVGLGSDFDGISVTPVGINDVSQMPEITRVMVERGYSKKRIQKILGANFMRVFKTVSDFYPSFFSDKSDYFRVSGVAESTKDVSGHKRSNIRFSSFS